VFYRQYSGTATIFFQTSPGQFGEGEEFYLGDQQSTPGLPTPIRGVLAADVDGDGDRDILMCAADSRFAQAQLFMLENIRH